MRIFGFLFIFLTKTIQDNFTPSNFDPNQPVADPPGYDLWDEEELQTKQRFKDGQISNHVVARWYRAPEVSLVEKQYDHSADMWSLGCMVAGIVSVTRHAWMLDG